MLPVVWPRLTRVASKTMHTLRAANREAPRRLPKTRLRRFAWKTEGRARDRSADRFPVWSDVWEILRFYDGRVKMTFVAKHMADLSLQPLHEIEVAEDARVVVHIRPPISSDRR